MSKVGSWVLGMQEDAAWMSREQFVKVHGAAQADVWDRVHQEEFDYELDPEMMEDFYGS